VKQQDPERSLETTRGLALALQGDALVMMVDDEPEVIAHRLEQYHEKNEEKYIFPEFVKARKLVDLVEMLKTQHAAGRKVMVWTVNQEKEMRQLAAMGVDGIVSDDTRLLGSVLGDRRRPG